MNQYLKILVVAVVSLLVLNKANATGEKHETEPINVREFILEHVADSYEWHITKIGDNHISIPLPVILYSKTSGWHVFMSSAFHHSPVHEGFYIAHEGKNKGKIVEKNNKGAELKPFDISITKNVFSLLFSSILLIVIILSVANSYRKHGFGAK
jgi:F-type H+-transporting ATPase subunit a